MSIAISPGQLAAQAAPRSRPSVHYIRLDVLRALAALAVFCFHSRIKWMGDAPHARLLEFAAPLQFGQLGVTLFFVLSGFCIHLSTLQGRARGRELKLGDFAVRRVFRIWPAYLAVLFLMLLREMAQHHTQGLPGDGITHLFMIHNFWPGYFFGLNPSFWSLANEVQFYLLYPILFYPLAKRIGWGGMALVAMVLTVLLQKYLMLHPMVDIEASKFYYFSVPVTAFEWLLGAWVAQRIFDGLPGLPAAPGVAICGLIGFAFVYTFAPPLYLNGTLAALIFAVLVGGYGVRNGTLTWLERILVPVGLVSYSFYLVHQPLIGLCDKVLTPRLARHLSDLGPDLLASMLCVIVTFALAGALYWFVERGGVAAGKWVLARRQPRTP